MLTVNVYFQNDAVRPVKTYQVEASRLDVVGIRSAVKAHSIIRYVEVMRGQDRVCIIRK
jgi:hypothetical protein